MLLLTAAVAFAHAPTSVSGSITADYTNTTTGAKYVADRNVDIVVAATHCPPGGDMKALHVEFSNTSSSGPWTSVKDDSQDWGENNGCTSGVPNDLSETFAWELADGSDGSRTVYMRVRHANDAAPASDTVVLDTTGPAVSITAPVNNHTTTDTDVTVVGMVTDAGSGVQSVTVALGSSTFATTLASGDSFATATNAVPLACGANLITAEAEDNVGNKTTSSSVTVTRDCGSVGDLTDDWKDAPAIANAFLKGSTTQANSCLAKFGKPWHGRTISSVAKWAETVDKADYANEAAWETAVRAQVSAICS